MGRAWGRTTGGGHRQVGADPAGRAPEHFIAYQQKTPAAWGRCFPSYPLGIAEGLGLAQQQGDEQASSGSRYDPL